MKKILGAFLFSVIVLSCKQPTPPAHQNYFHLNFKPYKCLTYRMFSFFRSEFKSGDKSPEVNQMKAFGMLTIVPQNDSLATVTFKVNEGIVFAIRADGTQDSSKLEPQTGFVLKNLRTDGTFLKLVDTVNSKNLDYSTYLFHLPKSTHRVGEVETDHSSFKYLTATIPMILTGPRKIGIESTSLVSKDTIYKMWTTVELNMSRFDSLFMKDTQASNKQDGQSEFNKSKGYFEKMSYNTNMLFNSPSKPDPAHGNSMHIVRSLVIGKMEYSLIKVE